MSEISSNTSETIFQVANNLPCLEKLEEDEKQDLKGLINEIKQKNNKNKVIDGATKFMRDLIFDNGQRCSYKSMIQKLNNNEGYPDPLKRHKFNIYLGVLLQNQGYNTFEINGEIGKNTRDENSNSPLRNAVGEFQKKEFGGNNENYSPDYVPGPITIDALLQKTSNIGEKSGSINNLDIDNEERSLTLDEILKDPTKLKDIKKPKIGNLGIGEYVFDNKIFTHGKIDEVEYRVFKDCMNKNLSIDAYLLYLSIHQIGTNEKIIKEIIYNKKDGQQLKQLFNLYNSQQINLLTDLYQDMNTWKYDVELFYDILRHISQFQETKSIVTQFINKKGNEQLLLSIKQQDRYKKFHLENPIA